MDKQYNPSYENDFFFKCDYTPSHINDFLFPEVFCDEENPFDPLDLYYGENLEFEITIDNESNGYYGEESSFELFKLIEFSSSIVTACTSLTSGLTVLSCEAIAITSDALKLAPS